MNKQTQGTRNDVGGADFSETTPGKQSWGSAKGSPSFFYNKETFIHKDVSNSDESECTYPHTPVLHFL